MEENKKPENPNAFPVLDHNDGMTIRDYFAAKSMQGIIAHFGFKYENLSDGHSQKAYQVADAMLKQREK